MTHDHAAPAAPAADPRFTFSFTAYDDLPDGARWSTWLDVDPLCRGPEPRPDWVVTSQGAVDTDLGVLKTGKEADVHLVRRWVPDGTARPAVESFLAAKRYRGAENRLFHRDSGYLDGRRVRKTRDMRAMQRRTEYGRALIAGQWAFAEFEALGTLWEMGLPVPYPVQLDDTEMLMEFFGDGRAAAPRPRPPPASPPPPAAAPPPSRRRRCCRTRTARGCGTGRTGAPPAPPRARPRASARGWGGRPERRAGPPRPSRRG